MFQFLCFSVTCPELNNPLNGTVKITHSGGKQTAYFSCDSGFGLVGKQLLECQKNGEWNDEASFCVGKSLIHKREVSIHTFPTIL